MKSFCNADVTIGTDKNVDRCSLFEKFSLSAMHRLKTNQVHDIDFAGIWKEAEPFAVRFLFSF